MNDAGKLQVLFVDDETELLEGLKRSLRHRRDQWTMTFATGGQEALRLLDSQPFDVLVTDMRMPAVDGYSVLKHAAMRHPHLVRMVLSGQCSQETLFKTLGPAHRFLTKPCEPAILASAIDRALALKRRLLDSPVGERLLAIEHLPCRPEVHGRLMDALMGERTGIDVVAAIIAEDPVMSAKILQVASYASFTSGITVNGIVEAVRVLGCERIKMLATVHQLFHQVPVEPSVRHLLDRVWSHSLVTSILAKRIATAMGADPVAQTQAHAAGLLHEIGALVEVTAYPEVLRSLGNRVGGDVDSQEIRAMGFTHAHAGGCLLWLWGLSTTVVEAVLHHHDAFPADLDPWIHGALRAADQLDHQKDPVTEGHQAGMSPDVVELLNNTGGVALWQEVHDQIHREVRS